MNRREIVVKLDDGFEYDYQGDKKLAKFVTLHKPTAKHINLTSIIKLTFQSAADKINSAVTQEQRDAVAEVRAKKTLQKVKEAEEKKVGADAEQDEDQSLDLSPADALEMFYAAPNSEDISKSLIAFKELLRSELAFFDGEEKATMPMINELSVEDFEKMLGHYLVNFIIASLLKRAQGD